jgi:transcription initiation factor IIE alpha subunit
MVVEDNEEGIYICEYCGKVYEKYKEAYNCEKKCQRGEF